MLKKKMKSLSFKTIKRAFDIAGASTAIVVSAPLWVIISMGIELSSKGPVFYRAARVGKNLKPFTLYKFRSMHVYVPQDKDDNGEKGFIADEDRIFSFGSFLRKSKLDELPQLLNILVNDMSIVGPRPMTQAGAEKIFVGEYKIITDVKPGLACLDSLYDYAHGELFLKDNDEYREKVLPVRTELAEMYIEKQSLALDAYCIYRTLKLIFQIAVLRKRDFDLTEYEIEASERVERKRNNKSLERDQNNGL